MPQVKYGDTQNIVVDSQRPDRLVQIPDTNILMTPSNFGVGAEPSNIKLDIVAPQQNMAISAPQRIIVPEIPPGYKDMSHPLSYLGTNPEKVLTVTPYNLTLADTTYSSWTASTTASSIWSDSSIFQSVSISPTEYDYTFIWTVSVDFAYNDGYTVTAMPVKNRTRIWYDIARYATDWTNIHNRTLNSTTAVAIRSLTCVQSTNSKGTLIATPTTYGVYGVAVAPTFPGSKEPYPATDLHPLLNLKLPSISARCNSSYFAVARKSEVNLANTHIKIEGELWRFDPNSSLERRARGDLMDLIDPPQ